MSLLGTGYNPNITVANYATTNAANEQAFQGAQQGLQASVEAYGQIKQFKGQQEAFGKSMDYMAKAFPDKAEMFNQAKSSVFDPNSNAIQQAAAMNQYQNQFDMIGKMQMQQAQLEMMRQRQQSAGAGATDTSRGGN